MNDRKRHITIIDTAYARLLCVYAFLRGALAAFGLYKLTAFVLVRLRMENPLGRLSSLPKLYLVLILGAAAFVGLVLLTYLLFGVFSPFCAFGKRLGIKACRIFAFIEGILYIPAFIALEIGGNYLIKQLSSTALSGDGDGAVLRMLLQFAALSLLFSAICHIGLSKVLGGALRDGRSKGSRALTLIAALMNAAFLSLGSLYLYYTFMKAGTVFSYSLTQLVPFELSTVNLTYALGAAKLVALKFIFIAGACITSQTRNGKTHKTRLSNMISALGVAALFLMFTSHMKDFSDVMSRYALYSRFISTLTLIKHPLYALSCLIMLAALWTKCPEALIAPGALIMAGTRASVLILQTPAVTFRSFDTAFETALPFVYVALWSLIALCALLALVIKLAKRRSLPLALRLIPALLSLIPFILSAIYYAENLSFMFSRAPMLSVIIDYIGTYPVPALAMAALFFCAGRRKKPSSRQKQ